MSDCNGVHIIGVDSPYCLDCGIDTSRNGARFSFAQSQDQRQVLLEITTDLKPTQLAILVHSFLGPDKSDVRIADTKGSDMRLGGPEATKQDTVKSPTPPDTIRKDLKVSNSPPLELRDFNKLYDIIDGWYHTQTRHHLVDLDPDVKTNLFDKLTALNGMVAPDHAASVESALIRQKAALKARLEAEIPTMTLQDAIDAKMFPTPEEYEKMLWVLTWYREKVQAALDRVFNNK